MLTRLVPLTVNSSLARSCSSYQVSEVVFSVEIIVCMCVYASFCLRVYLLLHVGGIILVIRANLKKIEFETLSYIMWDH
jgi:hypothetical protein